MPNEKTLTGDDSAACDRMRLILDTAGGYGGYTLTRDEAFELTDLAAKVAAVFPHPCTKCGGDVDGQGFLGPPIEDPPANPHRTAWPSRGILLHRLCQTCFDTHQET